MDDSDELAIQQVEAFERVGPEAAWVPVGAGTVLWSAGADGSIEQRLLVMQRGDNGEWARELEALDFPDPNATMSCLPEDNVITWRRVGQPREVALAFASVDGCTQVWEDLQALQQAVLQQQMPDEQAMAEYLEHFSELYGAGACPAGADAPGMGGGPLPLVSAESLPTIAMRLTSCPPYLTPLLLQQLLEPSADGSTPRTSAASPLDASPPNDYVAALSALARQLGAAPGVCDLAAEGLRGLAHLRRKVP